MTKMRSLVTAALDAQVRNSDELRQLDRLQSLPTLTRPISDFGDWSAIEHLGDNPKPWDPSLALRRLDVRQVPFEAHSPRLQGESRGRMFSVAPNSFSPVRTLIHELAHIELGHTFASTRGDKTTALIEVHAETVAVGVLALIGATRNLDVSLTYLHDYGKLLKEPVAERDITQIGHAIEVVLAAGRCACAECLGAS